MREIFALVGEITVAGLDATKAGLQAVENQFTSAEKALFKFGQQSQKIGTTLSKDITAPLVAASAAVGLLAEKTVNYAVSLSKLEDQTGMSSKSLQELRYVAKSNYVEFDSVSIAVAKLAKEMPNIAKQTGPAYDAMKKLGINCFDAKGNIRDMNDLFPDIIKKLENISNPMERSAAAAQIFGKGSKELAPILALSNAQFDAARKKAEDLGLVMGGGALKAAKDFGKQVIDLKEQANMLLLKLGSDLIPILRDTVLPLIQTKIVPAILEFAAKVKDAVAWFQSLDKTTKDNILSFLGFAAVAGPALLIFGKVVLAIKSLQGALILAKTATIALTTSMSVNPFAVAIIGAAALVALLLKLQSLENQTKENEAKTAKNNAIAAQLRDFQKLKEEQENIIKTGEASHFQLYSRESVEQAKTNLKSIQDAIVAFNRDNGIGPKPGTAAPTPTKSGGGGMGASQHELEFRKEYEKKIIESNNKLIENEDAKVAALLQINKDEEAKAIMEAQQKGFKIDIVQRYFATQAENIVKESEKKKADLVRAQTIAMLNQRDQEVAQETTDESKKLTFNLAILQRNYEESIRIAMLEGRETLIITEQYEDAKAHAITDAKKKIKDAAVKEQVEILNANGQTVKALKLQRDSEVANAEGDAQKIAGIYAKYNKLILQNRISTAKDWLNVAATAINGIGSLLQKASDNELINIQNQQTAEINAINHSTLSQAQKQKKIDAINAETAKKEHDLKKKAAEEQKAVALLSAIVGTAAAVVNALANSGNPILGIVMAALVGALGIIQIGLIAAEPIPLAQGAMIQGGRGGIMAQIGEGIEDEVVMPLKTGAKAMAAALLDALGGKGAPLPAYAAAGGPSASFGGSRESHVHYHIGTLIADDHSLKELERRQSQFRVSEQQRKGE